MLQNRVVSLEFSLESKADELRSVKQCEELVQIKEKLKKTSWKAEQMHQKFLWLKQVNVLVTRRHFCSSECCYWNFSCPGEQGKRVVFLNEKLETEQAEIGELKKNKHTIVESLKELQFLSEPELGEKELNSSFL